MKCAKCGAEWTTNISNAVTVCPFCGEPLMGVVPHQQAIEALKIILDRFGVDIYFEDKIFKVLLMSMMIPGMMFMVPQFFMICKMGLFGTKWAMFLPHLASVFGIFPALSLADLDRRILVRGLLGGGDFGIFYCLRPWGGAFLYDPL